MPRRRQQSLVDALIEAPWWISVLLGGIVAVLAKLALPTAFTSPMFVPLDEPVKNNDMPEKELM